jgi:hypothetical protein
VFADRVADASIPVERARAKIVAVAGSDDQMWPSLLFAQHLEARRGGVEFELIVGDDAGHRITFPGETSAPDRAALYAYGGLPAADEALGAVAWRAALRLAQLD